MNADLHSFVRAALTRGTTRDAIAAAFNDMRKEGTYDKLMDKYGIETINSWKDWSGSFKAYHTQ